jgi:hypothetical protein
MQRLLVLHYNYCNAEETILLGYDIVSLGKHFTAFCRIKCILVQVSAFQQELKKLNSSVPYPSSCNKGTTTFSPTSCNSATISYHRLPTGSADPPAPA